MFIKWHKTVWMRERIILKIQNLRNLTQDFRSDWGSSSWGLQCVGLDDLTGFVTRFFQAEMIQQLSKLVELRGCQSWWESSNIAFEIIKCFKAMLVENLSNCKSGTLTCHHGRMEAHG